MPTATQRTYTPKANEVVHSWRVIDAEGKVLGRLATEVAGYLRGKHLPMFAEHMDVGDFVVVVNAAGIRVTGDKLRQKMYYRHSNYPGGFKAVALGDLLAKHPERVIKHAVKGMLPHNTLGRQMLKKLKVYAGPSHPHEAQLIGGTPMVGRPRRRKDAEQSPPTRASAPAAPPKTTATAAAPTGSETQVPPTAATTTEEQTA